MNDPTNIMTAMYMPVPWWKKGKIWFVAIVIILLLVGAGLFLKYAKEGTVQNSQVDNIFSDEKRIEIQNQLQATEILSDAERAKIQKNMVSSGTLSDDERLKIMSQLSE